MENNSGNIYQTLSALLDQKTITHEVYNTLVDKLYAYRNVLNEYWASELALASRPCIEQKQNSEVTPVNNKPEVKLGVFINTINLQELELAAIEVGLSQPNPTLGKLAYQLGISERTLYRKKIDYKAQGRWPVKFNHIK